MRLLGDAYTQLDAQRIADVGTGVRAGAHSEGGALAKTGNENSYGEMSYGELDRRARGVASALAGHGVVAGDRVALMLPTSDEYFAIFAGILLAGCVPVPIYPPARPSQLEEHLLRQVGILSSAQVGVLVTIPEARQLARLVPRAGRQSEEGRHRPGASCIHRPRAREGHPGDPARPQRHRSLAVHVG